MLAAESIAYESGVLVPGVHDRIVADIENVALDALIQPEYIWTKLDPSQYGSDVVSYVRRFKFHRQEGTHGLVLGKTCENPEDTMAAIAGALVRNFIRARVCTLNQVVESSANGSLQDVSCLLIPNFYTGSIKAGKDAQAAWRVAALHDVLVARHAAGLQTVVYVSDMNELTQEYGMAVRRHLITNFAS